MRNVPRRILVAGFLALVVTTAARPAEAGIISGTISLDTSALLGTFELAFILTDGSGTGDANSAVTLSSFMFGAGGSAGAVDATLSTGGVGGDLVGGASLVDSAFLNIFAASFSAGSSLSVNFDLSTNIDAGGTPDQFSLALLRSDGAIVNTGDPSGANSLLTVNFDSASPAFNVFASDLTPAPIVTQVTPIPEPPNLPLLAVALTSALWLARKSTGCHRPLPADRPKDVARLPTSRRCAIA